MNEVTGLQLPLRQSPPAVRVVLSAASPAAQTPKGLTEVAGIKVGHHTLTERPTGCTVILVDGDGAVGGVSQRGGAPGTRETDLLDPANMVDKVNAVVLSGGSAYGLDAAQGVVRYLEEQNIGWKVGVGVVPIVPAAILFDLPFGGKPQIRPTADCGYKAAQAATDAAVAEGNIGAGAGATVGKMGMGRSMKGGIGSAAIALPNGLVVAAIVAVNAVGDIIDPTTGKIVAGVRTRGRQVAGRRPHAAPKRRADPAAGAARRREHDDRPRRHQRPADQGRHQPRRDDGRRRLRAGDYAVAHGR